MSIEFIPIQLYTPIYYHVLLIMVLITFFQTDLSRMGSKENKDFMTGMGVFILLFVVAYMGFRPIHGVFVDMTTYAHMITQLKSGIPLTLNSDILFQIFIQFSAKYFSTQTFFLICSLVYIIPLYIVTKKWFKDYWFYAFLMLVGSLSFWAYGTNGIRNGMATSIFLLALSRDNKLSQLLWITIAVGFHLSLLLPAVAYLISILLNKPRIYLYLWFAAIPLSLVMPGFWENLFSGLIDDPMANYFTDDTYLDAFSRTGFRWDFLLYSATGVFAGWYYIFFKKISDNTYSQLLNIYLIANAYWILVIRASFSNRFAYLSWFLLALVIIYPLLKKRIVFNQHWTIGGIQIAYFSFTYFMGIILK